MTTPSHSADAGPRAQLPDLLIGDTQLRPSGPTPHPSAPAASLPTAPASAAGQSLGRYVLMESIGRGGMGEVWRAWDPELQREVALKRLHAGADRERLARFFREARLAAKLTHPGIVPLYDVSEIDGQPCLVSELVLGRTLARTCEAPPIAPRRVAEWLLSVAEALAYAHGRGVVHRDLKPANILLGAAGMPRLTDFGLARDLATDADADPLTTSGELLGTPVYMSPEQAGGRADAAGPAADQFSLGVVMYQLLTGELPFSGATLRELLNAIVERDPVAPRALEPGIPRDLESICLKALQKQPARRYADLSALAADLRSWLHGEPVQVRPLSWLERGRRWTRRSGMLNAVLAVSGVSLVLVGALVRIVDRSRAAATRAESEAAAATDLYSKAGRLAAVVSRWSALAPALQQLEQLRYDARLTPVERQAAMAPILVRLDAFVRATPADPTSSAAARAFGGWGLRLAGQDAEALEAFAQAERADPDVPLAALFRAMVLLTRMQALQSRPPLPMGGSGRAALFDSVVQEPPELEELRREAQTAVERARRSRLWGEECIRDFWHALDAVRAAQVGDHAAAESLLTVALGAGSLAPIHSGLRLQRGIARLFQQKCPEALVDLSDVVELRPGDPTVLFWQAVCHYAMAVQDGEAGKSPEPELAQAAALLEPDGLGEKPSVRAVLLRAQIHQARGRWREARGEDPADFFQAAAADLDRVLAVDPDRATALGHRAALRYRESRQGTRPPADRAARLEAAYQDIERATRAHCPVIEFWLIRAQILCALADQAMQHGKPAGQWLDQAEQSIRRVRDRRPTTPELDALDARVSLHRAQVALLGSREPLGYLKDTRAILERLRQSQPEWATVYVDLALVQRAIGDREGAAGSDPGPSYARSLRLAEEALRLDPGSVGARLQRSLTRLQIARRDLEHGKDCYEDLLSMLPDLEQAVAEAPEDPRTHRDRAGALVSLAQAGESHGVDPEARLAAAIADYDLCIGVWAQDLAARQERGNIQRLLAERAVARGQDAADRLKVARADLELVAGRRRESWQMQADLARVCDLQQDHAAAVAAWDRAAKLAPKNVVVRSSLQRAQIREQGGGPGLDLLDAGWNALERKDRELAARLYQQGIESLAQAPAATLPPVLARLAAAWYNLGCIHAQTGHPDQAFAALTAAIQGGWRDVNQMLKDPDLKPLHADPRWAEVIKSVK